MSTALDKFLVTAMDRFVWFILMVVATHLVTEFTKTNGYTRGERRNMIPINESTFLNAIEVPYWMQNANHNLDIMEPPNEANNEEEKTFSIRPFIDSIFEIPLTALSAVNRFVQRLTAGYSASPTAAYSEKSPMRQKSS